MKSTSITILTILSFVLFGPLLVAQPTDTLVRIERTAGLGRSTGHIADLWVINRDSFPVALRSQVFYIPSDSLRQSYLGRIPSGIILPPGSRGQVPVGGFCLDIQRTPVPSGKPMADPGTWVPIESADSLLQRLDKIVPESGPWQDLATGDTITAWTIIAQPGVRQLISAQPVSIFSPEALMPAMESSGYKPGIRPADSIMITWPGTSIPVQGTFDPGKDEETFAGLSASLLERIDSVYRVMAGMHEIQTPYAPDPDLEYVTVLQHTCWIYQAALSGQPYRWGQFREKIREAASVSQGNKIDDWSAPDQVQLEEGIQALWASFRDVGQRAQVFSASFPTGDTIGLSSIQVRVEGDTVKAPWKGIPVVGEQLKPLYSAPKTPVAVRKSGPWLPLFIGTSNAALLVYLAGREKQDTKDCSFIAMQDVTAPSCGQANGSIRITTDATAELNYAWSNGQATAIVDNLSAGQYTVTITQPGTSCNKTLNIELQETTIDFSITLETMDAGCGQTNGSVSGLAEPPGAYAWTWSTGSSETSLQDLSPGTYQVTVSAGGTCVRTATAVIAESAFDPVINIQAADADCGQANGSLSVTIDPPGQYDLQWSNGQGGSFLSDLSPGNYSVTVSLPGTSCSQSASATVAEKEIPFTISVSSVAAQCGLTDGSATVVADPPGDYDYLWSDGQADAQAGNLAPGEYSVTVTVAGTTCSRIEAVMVDEQPPAFQLQTSAMPASCGLSDGEASVQVDPPGSYDYLWSAGADTPMIDGLAPGNYTVTVTQAGTTCFLTGEVMVEELPPSFTASFDTEPAHCTESNGRAVVTVDPPGSYDYAWSDGSTGDTLTEVSAGMYSVTITVAGTSCFLVFTTDIPQTGAEFSATVSTTPGDCGLLTGSATVVPDPEGTYTYAWSNHQAGPVIDSLLPGSYDVTITDTSGCALSIPVEIAEIPAHHLVLGMVVPGNCLGGGDIQFVLETAGTGPIELQVSGPTGTTQQTLSPGSYSLSSWLEVAAGAYQLLAYDQGAGSGCTDTLDVTVPDTTLAPEAIDDAFSTMPGMNVEGNILANDTGLMIQVTGVSDLQGGTLDWMPDGTFTFVPDGGFQGIASFVYTIADACGSSATGTVNITVQPIACDFTAAFVSLPAHCGLADGSLSVTVDPPGAYTYIWSNGGTGISIEGLGAGPYSVTVTNPDDGCELVFDTLVTELPADPIGAFAVEQPSCLSTGEIQANLQAPAGHQLSLVVDHPGGTVEFLADPGPVLLSSYLPIQPGTYSITVYDAMAGPACAENAGAVLEAFIGVNLVLENVFPPSDPGASDGEAAVVDVNFGALPYALLVDDVPAGTVNDHAFTVGGLNVGEHIIQVIDANGCPSDQLFVNIPPPDIGMSFTTGWQTGPVYDSQPERPAYAGQALGFVLGASITRWRGRWGQEAGVSWMPALPGRAGPATDRIQLDFFLKPLPWHSGRHSLSIKGGAGIRYVPALDLVEPCLVWRSAYAWQLTEGLSLTASLGIEAGLSQFRPLAGLQVSMPIRFPRSIGPASGFYPLLDSSLSGK